MKLVPLIEEFPANAPAQASIKMLRSWAQFGSIESLFLECLIIKHVPSYSGRLKLGVCSALFVVCVTDITDP